jgi:hypothetical protein
MSFIRDFLTYNQGSESPKPYVLWTAYGLLSAAIGRRVWLDLTHFRVMANVYILLIGPSGGRKTASLDKGVDLLKEAIPDLPVAGSNETYQGIITYMHSDKSERSFVMPDGEREIYKPYCIFSSELMDYLQLNPIGMVSFLTNIYDRKHYIYRLKNEEHVLKNAYVMMCACSTPEWLTDQLKAKQFAEGYGRRTIFVCHEGIIRKKPTMSTEEHAAGRQCLERIQKISGLSGPMTLTPEADKWFWYDWYPNIKDPDDQFLQKWYSSKHINLLKVAMLTSLSERDDLVITLDYLQMSLGLLDAVETGLPMVTQRMGRSDLVGPSLTILYVVKANKGVILKKELLAKTFKDFRDSLEQWRTIEHLKATEQLVEAMKDGRTYIALPTLTVKVVTAPTETAAAPPVVV